MFLIILIVTPPFRIYNKVIFIDHFYKRKGKIRYHEQI